MKLNFEEPISRVMVIVPQGSGDRGIYDYAGPSVCWYVGEFGISSLNCIDPPDEPGVWVWEGHIWDQKYDTLDGPEWDTESDGTQSPTEHGGNQLPKNSRHCVVVGPCGRVKGKQMIDIEKTCPPGWRVERHPENPKLRFNSLLAHESSMTTQHFKNPRSYSIAIMIGESPESTPGLT